MTGECRGGYVGYSVYRLCFTQNGSQVVSKFQQSLTKLEIIACLCKLLLCEDKTQAPDNPYARVMQKLENVLAMLLFIFKNSRIIIFHFHLKPIFFAQLFVYNY